MRFMYFGQLVLAGFKSAFPEVDLIAYATVALIRLGDTNFRLFDIKYNLRNKNNVYILLMDVDYIV